MWGFIYIPECVWNGKVFFFPLLSLWANGESTENTKIRSYKLIRKLSKEETMSLYNYNSTSESNSLQRDIKDHISRKSPLCICSGNVSAATVSAQMSVCKDWGDAAPEVFHICALFTLEASTLAFSAASRSYRVTSFPFSLVGSQVACSINLISLSDETVASHFVIRC